MSDFNKAQALQNFWSGFEWIAYDENTVPEDAPFPRITYQSATDSLDNKLLLTASLYDKSMSWERVEKKAEQIAHELVHMYPAAIRIAGGGLYITKGTPFAQRLDVPEDDTVRRIILNINVEYLTAE